MKKLFIVLAILFLACPVFAEDLYYAASAVGSGDASSCANAKAYTGITWGSGAGNVGAGDTLHLCGTITTTTGESGITVGASGTEGSPITIKFEDNAILQSARFKGGIGTYYGGIDGNAKSYITIDGGTNGIIQNTANGTVLDNHAGSNGICFKDSDHIEIKNLTIRNIYVPSTVTGINTGSSTSVVTDSLSRDMASIGVKVGMRVTNTTTGQGNSAGIDVVSGATFSSVSPIPWITFSDGDGWQAMETVYVYAYGINMIGTSDVSIHDNTITYTGDAIAIGSSSDYNFNIYNNTLQYNAVGIIVGTTASGQTLDNIYIHHNTISEQTNWGYTDCIKFMGQNSVTNAITQVHIYNNTLGPNIGTATGHILIDHANYEDAVHGPLIYNNLLLLGNENPAQSIQVGGYSTSTPSAAAFQILNNTIVSQYTGSDIAIIVTYAATGNIIKNNIISYPSSTGTITAIYAVSPASITDSDNNDYYVPSGSLRFYDGTSKTLDAWKAAHAGFDTNSITSNPSLSGAYKPDAADDPIVGTGEDLTSTGITTDKDGNSRPSGSAWTIGAYEWDTEADTDTPDLVSMTINVSGATATLVLDEAVTVNNGSGFTLDCDGGEGEGLSYVSGLTFNVTGRIIDDDETCTFAYTTVAHGIEDVAGNDLESIVDGAVTNSSEHTPTEVSFVMTPTLLTGNCSLSPNIPTNVITGATTVLAATCNNGWRPVWSATGTCVGTVSGVGDVTYTTGAITGDCGVTLTPTEILLFP